MVRTERFSNEDLWNIIKKHKNAFTVVREWNDYARENGLPHAQTIIKRLGNWNSIKNALKINTNNNHRPLKYEVEELLKILQEHKAAYKTMYDWNQYAIQNKLPTHQVFEKYLGIEKLEELIEHPLMLSKELIKNQIKGHFPDGPPTVTEWKVLSETNKSVVAASTIIRYFNSWSNLKYEVYRR